MRDPNIILDIIKTRSINKCEINNIYPLLYKQQFYLTAYNKLSKNSGSLTPGETNETIDGMSLKRIDTIIDEMRYERYKWYKLRQVDIPKSNGGFRTLSIPEWRDKLVQEVMRMILSAIYEPKFLDCSHGFRPGRGCHTALQRIKQKSVACSFFIEGDITKCFDSIDHNILLNILKRDIKDNRFIELIRKMLKAGKFGKDFIYGKTYSGTPQGGVLSPLLANIYLNELDQYIENTLVPKYHNNLEKKHSKEYDALWLKIKREQKRLIGNNPNTRIKKDESIKRLKEWRKKLRSINSKENDEITKSRRLIYTRYADDWIISFTGPFNEAKEIKQYIKDFLKDNLKLELSEEKTKITIASNEKNPARFLSYNIITQWNNNKICNGKRSLGGVIALMIPDDVITNKSREFTKNNKPVHKPEYLSYPIYDIIKAYQYKLKGISQYYKFARNQQKLATLKYVMETSLAKTLASKLKISVNKVFNKYNGLKEVDGYKYKVVMNKIIDKNGKEHIAYFGAIPFKTISILDTPINDQINSEYILDKRNSLANRLINNKCEICGSDDRVQIHHIKHMKDIKNNKAEWAKKMIAINRKTIALCHKHHLEVHKGKYNGKKLK